MKLVEYSGNISKYYTYRYREYKGEPHMPKAQDRFLTALRNVLNKDLANGSYLDTAPKLHIKSDYRSNEYKDKRISGVLDIVLEELHSTYDFSNRNLPVDSCIQNHPKYLSRIVEFDEAQHFSMSRLNTITILENEVKFRYFEEYKELFKNPLVTSTFRKVIKGRSGFTKPVPGFQFSGGRTNQRAYYDLLKDIAHLSSENSKLSPIVRFSIFEFEFQYKKKFIDIPLLLLENAIEYKLNLIVE